MRVDTARTREGAKGEKSWVQFGFLVGLFTEILL